VKPGRIFGRDLPGQFMAARLRAVTSELSTPERVGRGREYAATDAVLSLDVHAGEVTATVLGSRAQPYEVTVRVTPGDGPPARHEVDARCTCPDEPEAAWLLCKHAVAALIMLAGEVAHDPDLLVRWRRPRAGGDPAASTITEPAAPPAPTPVDADAAPSRAITIDALDAILRMPDGAVVPEIPDLEPLPGAPLPGDLDRALTLALDVLRGERCPRDTELDVSG